MARGWGRSARGERSSGAGIARRASGQFFGPQFLLPRLWAYAPQQHKWRSSGNGTEEGTTSPNPTDTREKRGGGTEPTKKPIMQPCNARPVGRDDATLRSASGRAPIESASPRSFPRSRDCGVELCSANVGGRSNHGTCSVRRRTNSRLACRQAHAHAGCAPSLEHLV